MLLLFIFSRLPLVLQIFYSDLQGWQWYEKAWNNWNKVRLERVKVSHGSEQNACVFANWRVTSLALNVLEIASQNMIICSVAQWTLDLTQMLLRRRIWEGCGFLKRIQRMSTKNIFMVDANQSFTVLGEPSFTPSLPPLFRKKANWAFRLAL